jgi:hypothetical protein
LIKDLNIRPKTLKLVQEVAGNTLEVIGIGKDLCNRIPAAPVTKRKDGQIRLHKTKKLLHNKRNVFKQKRPPTEWEKILPAIYQIKD